jgi:hypothetical protein
MIPIGGAILAMAADAGDLTSLAKKITERLRQLAKSSGGKWQWLEEIAESWPESRSLFWDRPDQMSRGEILEVLFANKYAGRQTPKTFDHFDFWDAETGTATGFTHVKLADREVHDVRNFLRWKARHDFGWKVSEIRKGVIGRGGLKIELELIRRKVFVVVYQESAVTEKWLAMFEEIRTFARQELEIDEVIFEPF